MMKQKRSAGAQKSSWNAKKRDDEKKQQLKNALQVLQIEPNELRTEPKLTEMLSARALGGLPRIMEAMRWSTDPPIVKFLERYDRISKGYQKIVPWEAIAILARVDRRQLLGSIILALREHTNTEVKIIALTTHPQITAATAQNALLPAQDGFRDRQLMHTALGFLTPPKGQTINFNVSGVEANSEVEIAPEDIDMNQVFPDVSKVQKLLEDFED